MSSQPIPTTDPALAQAVQIPLQTFTIPSFPPNALTAPGIKSLILTSDIQLSSYQSLLSTAFTPIPELPASIQSLTLELFTLGYPAGFLSQLAARLPNLKRLTIFGQLIAGVEDAQSIDAEAFFEEIGRRGGLWECHLIDAFAKKDFWSRVGGHLNPANPPSSPAAIKSAATQTNTEKEKDDNEEEDVGLKLLEISYTYRHSDSEFLTRIHASDLLSLLHPSLVALSINISPPTSTQQGLDKKKVDEDDPENLDPDGNPLQKRPEGVMVLHPTHTPALLASLVEKWKGEDGGLKMLALTLFTLSALQLDQILSHHPGLRVLNVTIAIDKLQSFQDSLLSILAKGKDLEVIEVVVSPGLEFYLAATNPKALEKTLSKIFPSRDDVVKLSTICENLRSFEMNVLRTTSFGKAEWDRDTPDAEWKGGISHPDGEVPVRPDGARDADVLKDLKERYEGKDDDGDLEVQP